MYLRHYRDILDSQFPDLRFQFPPYTTNQIGFFGEFIFDQKRLGPYGLRPIKEQEEEVIFSPVGEFFRSTISYTYDVDQLHYVGSCNGFITLDIKQRVLHDEIIPSLKDIVTSQSLNEAKCPELIKESILVLIKKEKYIFKEFFDERGFEINFPIDLQAIVRAVKRYSFRRQVEEEEFERLKVETNSSGNETVKSFSHSIRTTPEFCQKVDERVEQLLTTGEEPEKYVIKSQLEAIESKIELATEAMQGSGISQIGPPQISENKIWMETLDGIKLIGPIFPTY